MGGWRCRKQGSGRGRRLRVRAPGELRGASGSGSGCAGRGGAHVRQPRAVQTEPQALPPGWREDRRGARCLLFTCKSKSSVASPRQSLI